MKKILTLLITLCCAYMMYPQQYTVDKKTVSRNIAKLSKQANWKTMEDSGKYPGMVALARDVVGDGKWTDRPGYTVIIPAMGYLADWINMDLSSDANERYMGGIFLDGSNPEHYIIRHNASGFEAPAGCLNPINRRIRYIVQDTSYTDLETSPGGTALDGGANQIIINNNCYPCNEGESESYVGTQQSGFDNFDVGTYGSPPQNSFPQNDFQNHFDNDSKEKTFFGTYVVPALIGFGIASIGFMAWDGFSDGEWFDFNGTKPRQIIRQVPFPSPGGGAGPAPNGMIFSF